MSNLIQVKYLFIVLIWSKCFWNVNNLGERFIFEQVPDIIVAYTNCCYTQYTCCILYDISYMRSKVLIWNMFMSKYRARPTCELDMTQTTQKKSHTNVFGIWTFNRSRLFAILQQFVVRSFHGHDSCKNSQLIHLLQNSIAIQSMKIAKTFRRNARAQVSDHITDILRYVKIL